MTLATAGVHRADHESEAAYAFLDALGSGIGEREAQVRGSRRFQEDGGAAAVTFLITASGLTLLGVGSAFWGLLFGVTTHLVLAARRREPMSCRHGRWV